MQGEGWWRKCCDALDVSLSKKTATGVALRDGSKYSLRRPKWTSFYKKRPMPFCGSSRVNVGISCVGRFVVIMIFRQN